MHGALQLLEFEAGGVGAGEEEWVGVDSSAFFLGQPGAFFFRDGVESGEVLVVVAVFGDFFVVGNGGCHEEVSDGGDDGGSENADGAFFAGKLLVDEFESAGSVFLLNGIANFEDDTGVGQGDKEADVIGLHFPALAEVEVDFFQFGIDLAGIGTGEVDEEFDGFGGELEFELGGFALDDAGDVFLPAFFGDVRFVEGVDLAILGEKFAEGAAFVEVGAAEDEVDVLGESVFEALKQGFGADFGGFGLAGAVGSEEVDVFEPDGFTATEEGKGLQGFDGFAAGCMGFVGVGGGAVDDFGGELVAAFGFEAGEGFEGMFGDAAFIAANYDVYLVHRSSVSTGAAWSIGKSGYREVLKCEWSRGWAAVGAAGCLPVCGF